MKLEPSDRKTYNKQTVSMTLSIKKITFREKYRHWHKSLAHDLSIRLYLFHQPMPFPSCHKTNHCYGDCGVKSDSNRVYKTQMCEFSMVPKWSQKWDSQEELLVIESCATGMEGAHRWIVSASETRKTSSWTVTNNPFLLKMDNDLGALIIWISDK